MFWNDNELTKKKHAVFRVPPPIPETGWRPPLSFPDLRNADLIGVDCEMKERDWDHGPGWARGKSHLVGVSVYAHWKGREPYVAYFPMRHEVEPEYNLDPRTVVAWLKEQLATPHIPKVGANLSYDLGCLEDEGIIVEGDLNDVQYAEAMLTASSQEFADPVNLDWLGTKYQVGGKDTDALYGWLKQAYPETPPTQQRGNIWRAPPRLVGPYAEQDARAPAQILMKQWPLLVNAGLLPLYAEECYSIRMLNKIRRRGIRVDLAKADQLRTTFRGEITELEKQIFGMTGIHANVNSPDDLKRIFDQAGVEYPYTARGNPSFVKEWLSEQEHPVAKLVNEVRGLEKIISTFLEGYILEAAVDSVIFPLLHPLKSDSGNSTKTGRYSSSDPNIQNLPVRSKAGKMVRECFIPHLGRIGWRKKDYSQIEYRMFANYAVDGDPKRIDLQRVLAFWAGELEVWGGEGHADRLRQTYIDDPSTDYHVRVMKEFAALTGKDLSVMSESEIATFRKPIKNVNFGLLYGQSEKALAFKAGMSEKDSATFFAGYHSASPHVKTTMRAIAEGVQAHGYTTTIAGRRCLFNEWEPADWGTRGQPCSYDSAIAQWGYRIKRAGDYRGVNYKLQGSAADVIKLAMIRCDREGVFEETGYPLMQVHDELDFDLPPDTPALREAHRHMDHILENSVKCRVPVKIDVKDGENWGVID